MKIIIFTCCLLLKFTPLCFSQNNLLVGSISEISQSQGLISASENIYRNPINVRSKVTAGEIHCSGENETTRSRDATDPNTYFIDYRGSLNQNGWWYQQFTVTGTIGFVLRFASTYSSDAAIFAPSQINGFTNNQSINAYVSFDNQIGYNYFTLSTGTYVIGVRNQVSASTYESLELDFQITLPTNEAQYSGAGIGNATLISNNYYYWHQLNITSGYRYFIDGCNSGLDIFVIPFNQLSNFNSGSTFQYFTDYSAYNEPAYPGMYEIRLSPGNYFLAVRNFSGKTQSLVYNTEIWRVVNGVQTLSNKIADSHILSQNYPNPFNPVTNIKFEIPKNEFVNLKVFDLAGREVQILVNQNMSAGEYKVDFNGSNLESGIYFYRIQAGDFSETRKMILLK